MGGSVRGEHDETHPTAGDRAYLMPRESTGSSGSKTSRGIEYRVRTAEGGWNFVLKGAAIPGAKYYLNGRAVSFPASCIPMSRKENLVLVVAAQRAHH